MQFQFPINGNTSWIRLILQKKDVSAIVYEVVNAKAASPENQGKRVPKPRTRKPKDQTARNSYIAAFFHKFPVDNAKPDLYLVYP